MSSRKIAFGILTLSFILIISGSVASCVLGLQQDREETYHRVHEVNDIFEVFSTNTSMFELKRDELYQDYLANIYYESMYQSHSKVEELFSNYEHLVDELSKNVVELKKYCDNMYYPDSSVNSKCSNYKSIYEQVMNYFVSDVQLYNKSVEQFNTLEERKGTLFRIRKYNTNKYYVDYNLDGEFDGCDG